MRVRVLGRRFESFSFPGDSIEGMSHSQNERRQDETRI
jgi:hypothetical protein